jgi:hypothetical protein
MRVTPVSEYAISNQATARRGSRASEHGFGPALLSEALAGSLAIEIAVVWTQFENGTLHLLGSNLPPTRYHKISKVLNAKLRPQIGITVGDISEAATVTPLLDPGRYTDPVSLRAQEEDSDDHTPTVGSEIGRCRSALMMRPDSTSSVVLELYCRYEPKPAECKALLGRLNTFCSSYVGGTTDIRGTLAAVELPDQASPIRANLSLSDIQDILFRRLTSRVPLGKPEQMFWMFLLDPEDDMLYFASTSQLRLKSPGSIRLRFLPGHMTEYIEHRIERLEHDHTRASHLKALYKRLRTQEYAENEVFKHEDQLRDLLKYLPQESDTGVGGAAVSGRVLSIGGATSWDEDELGRVHTKPSFCGKMVIDGNHS